MISGDRFAVFCPSLRSTIWSSRLQQVLETDEPQECETIADDGTCYLMRMLPYRTQESVEGVVLMLVDVSSLEVLRDRLRWMSAIVESTDDAIVGQDLNGVITSWNAGAQRSVRLHGRRGDRQSTFRF